MKPTASGSVLAIPPLTLPGGGESAPQTLDLAPYQGVTARVYLNAAGRVEVNPAADSYWQVAEVALPPPASERVQDGSREETASEIVMVCRGADAGDAVPLSANQWIGQVGFDWSPYVDGVDYTVKAGAIAWAPDGRAPAAGDHYPVEIVTATTVPVYVQRPLPLDLARHAITFFDLP